MGIEKLHKKLIKQLRRGYLGNGVVKKLKEHHIVLSDKQIKSINKYHLEMYISEIIARILDYNEAVCAIHGIQVKNMFECAHSIDNLNDL